MTDPDTKLKYEHDMMTEKDYYSILNTYRDEGKAEGIVEGIAKGKEEGKAEGVKEGLEKGRADGIVTVAKKMIDSGMDADYIASVTGLSSAQIKNL